MASVCRQDISAKHIKKFALLFKGTHFFFQPYINDKHPISNLENWPDDGY